MHVHTNMGILYLGVLWREGPQGMQGTHHKSRTLGTKRAGRIQKAEASKRAEKIG